METDLHRTLHACLQLAVSNSLAPTFCPPRLVMRISSLPPTSTFRPVSIRSMLHAVLLQCCGIYTTAHPPLHWLRNLLKPRRPPRSRELWISFGQPRACTIEIWNHRATPLRVPVIPCSGPTLATLSLGTTQPRQYASYVLRRRDS